MCPTPLGRIHSRVFTLTIPAIVALVISLVSGNIDWIVLIGVFLLLGVTLDAGVYSWLLKYQPPWMTGVLALGEFGLLFALVNILELDLTAMEAILFYWVVWALVTATRIAVLPNVSLTYLESSGEIRRVEWSIPPQQASLPIIASEAEVAAGPGPVIEAASGVRAVPLERKPGPSGVRAALPRPGNGAGGS